MKHGISSSGAQRPKEQASPEKLRRAVRRHLKKLGFVKRSGAYAVTGAVSKQTIRDLHAAQRHESIEQNREFINEHGPSLSKHFAVGTQVEPAQIDPELVEVLANTEEARLFRFACLLWSVPVSQGFGRRIRFLVRDRHNGALMGLFALGDPVFNLSARDNWIGWNHKDRAERLVHVMDTYVVGAMPPYSFLIGGKLIAALMGSKEVSEVYERKYFDLTSVISKKQKHARLVLLTTTSALGRSSIYNRLCIPGGPRFERIGVTKGFGHFHLSGEIFDLLRGYLEEIKHPYASGHRFGMGPNWKIRVARAALEELDLDADSILRHGIGREVYAVPLAPNWKQVLLGKEERENVSLLSVSEISDYCRHRWMVPRSERDRHYRRFARCRIMECLTNGGPDASW